MNEFIAIIWRRGRGLLRWKFKYEARKNNPGFYHRARKNEYRINIDSHYNKKLVWLGTKEGKEWVSQESLYEPLAIIYPDNAIVGNLQTLLPEKTSRRSSRRVNRTKTVIGAKKTTVGVRG